MGRRRRPPYKSNLRSRFLPPRVLRKLSLSLTLLSVLPMLTDFHSQDKALARAILTPVGIDPLRSTQSFSLPFPRVEETSEVMFRRLPL